MQGAETLLQKKAPLKNGALINITYFFVFIFFGITTLLDVEM